MNKRSALMVVGVAAVAAILASVISTPSQVIPQPGPPTPIGGAYNATPPTLTDGQAGWAQVDSAGNIRVNVAAGGGVGTFNNNADNVATSSTNGQAAAWNYVWDGSAWDRLYGDSTNGAFVNVKTSVLPTGAASAANQATEITSLASIVTNTGTRLIGITPTDRTVTSATGASQTVMSANATRKQLTIVNTGNANCGVNPTGGTAAIGGAGTLTLAPLGSYTPLTPTLSAITAICTAAQPLYADEG